MPGAPEKGREFERYALLATFVLIVAALVVRDRVLTPSDQTPPADSTDVMRVVLGGPDSEQHIATVMRTPARPRRPAVPQAGGVPVPPPSPAIPPPGDPAPAPAPAAPERTYVVQPGETLSQIAMRELGTVRRVAELARLNGITNRNRLRAGQTLKLPAE